MALLNCPECHKEYSDQAKACIHCGAKKVKAQKKSLVGTLLLAFLFACIAVGMIQNARTPPEDPQVKADRDARSMAATVCRMAFEKKAHDPASIEWVREERVAMFGTNKDKSPDRSKIITSEGVRAKNKLGALIKSTVTCQTENKQGNWNVTKLKVSNS